MSDMIRPLPLNGLADHHCHCDYSIDAERPLEEYCEAALKRNLSELCLTTHYDANPKSVIESFYIRVKGQDIRTTPDALAPYVDDVMAAKEKFASRGLRVKLGVEFGWYDNCEEEAERLFAKYPFEYKLCGVHEINDICFCSQSTYERCFEGHRPEWIVEDYFRQAIAAASCGLFDTIAHLGYYLRKGVNYYGESMLAMHRPYMDQFLSAMKATNTELEINTGGVRHGHNFYYPTPEMIALAVAAGVPVSHLGSDSHRPEHIGFQFDRAYHSLSHVRSETAAGKE